jgi:hypothetical protein
VADAISAAIGVHGLLAVSHPVVVGNTGHKPVITIARDIGAYDSYPVVGTGTGSSLYLEAGPINGIVLPGEISPGG